MVVDRGLEVRESLSVDGEAGAPDDTGGETVALDCRDVFGGGLVELAGPLDAGNA